MALDNLGTGTSQGLVACRLHGVATKHTAQKCIGRTGTRASWAAGRASTHTDWV